MRPTGRMLFFFVPHEKFYILIIINNIYVAIMIFYMYTIIVRKTQEVVYGNESGDPKAQQDV